MTDTSHTHLNKAGEQISLTNEERERMRGMLRAHMEMNPVRPPASSAYATTVFARLFSPRPIAAFLVLALFASSAGISYAAQNALPGDFLYPIKTNVNEPIQGALAVSPSAKEAWAMNVAGERIQEAATLAAEGRLGTTTQQELQSNFQEHAQIATENIREEASSSPETSDETAVRFEAQLSEDQNVLAQIATATNANVAPLTTAIKTESANVEAVRASAESHFASTTDEDYAAARMQIAAQQQFDASADLAQGASQSLSSSSEQLVSVQLAGASTTISAGEDLAAKHEAPGALGAFQNALTATEELGVFLQTSSDIHSHTGLVVGQPQGEQSTTTEKIRSGNRTGGNSGNVKNATTSPATTSTSTASSSAPRRYQAFATSTDIDQNEAPATTGSVQAQAGVQQSVTSPAPSAPQLPTLPVSVPVHLSL